MLKEGLALFKPAISMLLLLTLLTGLIYPLFVTFFAQILFPWQANGSLVYRGKVIASKHIGQNFTSPGYFWGRPSATIPFPYHAKVSRGSNSGPLNMDYLARVKERVQFLKQWQDVSVPIDLVTTSASGLDPEISPFAAYYQVPRIAKVRNLPETAINALVQRHTRQRTFFVLGEPRINVFLLNLELDGLQEKH